jgi:hypothetical protein
MLAEKVNCASVGLQGEAFDHQKIALQSTLVSRADMWRYRPILPVSPVAPVINFSGHQLRNAYGSKISATASFPQALASSWQVKPAT